MNPNRFLLLNLALAGYNAGTIWAHEIDIFRSWRLVGAARFHDVQRAHWRKLPYWVLAPVGLAFAGSIALLWYRPAGPPLWAPWGGVFCQLSSIVLTAALWGRWQARLAQDPLGPESVYLRRILKTHWLRTLLVNAYAVILLVWAISVLS